MKRNIFVSCALLLALLHGLALSAYAQKAPMHSLPADGESLADGEINGQQQNEISMLQSLVALQADTKKQVNINKEKLRLSGSEIEKKNLALELDRLDRQLAEATDDFERIATNVDVSLFDEKKEQTFSWQEEMTELMRPAVKELKRLTERSRNKTKLRDAIQEYQSLVPVAGEAVSNIENLISVTENPLIVSKLKALLPEWQNTTHRIQNKLELAQRQLERLEEQETNLSDSLSNSAKDFFRNRGIYLLGAVLVFFITLLLARVAYRFVFSLLARDGEKNLPFHVRLLDLIFRIMAVVLATFSSFLILYLAEDWFLLSMAIIFFLGFTWTVRQGAAKLWQQARLMLNVGSIREGERVVINSVPWKIERIHVFCTLYNPSLEQRIKLPIENMVGMVSRTFKPEDPWFPCKKGDWVVVGDSSRGRVVSLSPETVELVERGGKRILYQTQDFLGASPVNLSRNFRLRVPFGITYNLQKLSTRVIPEMLRQYIDEKLNEEGYGKSCLNLMVEFAQAGGSSLDIVVIADFKGDKAEIYTRLERFIQRCCVEACTLNDWEIPFPQLTFHWPARERLMEPDQA